MAVSGRSAFISMARGVYSYLETSIHSRLQSWNNRTQSWHGDYLVEWISMLPEELEASGNLSSVSGDNPGVAVNQFTTKPIDNCTWILFVLQGLFKFSAAHSLRWQQIKPPDQICCIGSCVERFQ